MKPVFVAIEGIDATGKTTHAALLVEHLRKLGREVVICRDPGCTPIGEDIRKLLLDNSSMMCQTCEAILFTASRAELVASVIKPALERGSSVVSDRFEMSSIAHQGYAQGVNLDDLRAINEFAGGGVYPDITIVLDISPELALSRMSHRHKLDRIEQRGLEYMKRARQGFLDEANRVDSAVVLSAVGAIDVVQSRIRYCVERILE